MSRVLTVILLSVFTFGCASQQVYEGAKRPPDEIAKIKPGSPSTFFAFAFDPAISIHEVSGTKLDRLSSGEFEVAPGTHTVKAILFNVGVGVLPWRSPPKTITFDAKGGETYVVFYRWRNRREMDWILTVKEESSSRIVAETSAQATGTRGDLVYNVCMQVHAKKFGTKMAPIVCEVIADECRKNPAGDECKKALAPLDGDMKASGSSMLFAAAHAGRTDIVKTMVDLGGDANAAVARGWTPLLIAAAEGHEKTVAVLLDARADPNVKNQLGRTALMFASSKGFNRIVADLLARGADPNAVPTDDQGWTALMVAARAGHVATVQALLSAGADVALRDKSGNTALALAEAQGHSNVARVLREHGRGP